MEGSPRAVVVTGMSGAGKSIVTRCFEDLGFRCVDNLPLELIEPLFTHIWQGPGVPWVVVVDVRTHGFTRAFPDLMARLKVKYPEVRLVFVEATTEAIVRRFSETRRPHPYRKMALAEAVARERAELEPVRALADEKLDTTALTP
ncbi:MAG TPA: RNase adapter RapZ, partial [Thermoanaerobaculaceae bacterium]|nr:RNase adapter RapZ [Thermoanaerobaculaceae bacterium]